MVLSNYACTPDYMSYVMDDASYDMSWNLPKYASPPLNVSQQWGENRSCNDPWVHAVDDTVAMPLAGRFRTYPGRGYSVLLANGTLQNLSIVDSLTFLREAAWVDNKTRAILVEFTVYNTPFNLFANVVLFFEIVGAGRLLPYVRIYTAKLYMLRDINDISAIVVYAGICYALLMIRLWRVVTELRNRCDNVNYLPPVKIAHDLIVIVSTNVAFAAYVMRYLAVMAARTDISREDNTAFVNFYAIVLFDYMFTCVLPVVIAVTLPSALLMFRVSHRILILSLTIRHLLHQLVNIAVWLFVTFSLFVAVTIFLLGPTYCEYSTVSTAVMSAASLCVGRPKFADDNFDVPAVVGQFFVLTAAVCMLMLWVPLIRAICIFGRMYTVVNCVNLSGDEGKFFQFIWRRLHIWSGVWNTREMNEHRIADEKDNLRQMAEHRDRLHPRLSH